MPVTPLGDARPAPSVLAQYLVECPVCAQPAAAHVDWSAGDQGQLVRFVCPGGCAVDAVALLTALSSAEPCAGRPAPAA